MRTRSARSWDEGIGCSWMLRRLSVRSISITVRFAGRGAIKFFLQLAGGLRLGVLVLLLSVTPDCAVDMAPKFKILRSSERKFF